MQEFTFTETKRIGSTYYFTLTGRVHSKEAAYMEHTLENAMKAGCVRIIINMCLVYTFTSVAIRVILTAYQKMKGRGGTLQIENPSENVRNVIGMTALDELLLK